MMVLMATCMSGCTGKAPENEKRAAITFTDANGNAISLDSTVKKIVVTNSDAAEILVSIGAGDLVVGAVDSIWMRPNLTDHMPNVVNVGKWNAPDIERIIALKPDIVISYVTSKPKLDQLTTANITVVYFDLLDLKKIPSEVRTLGKITGHEKQAEDYASFIEKYTKLISDRTGNLSAEQRPDVYIESGVAYTTRVSGDSLDTMISLAGGENLGAKDPTLKTSAKVSEEWVVKGNPDIIIKYRANYSYTIDELADMKNEIMNRKPLANVKAVKNDKVYVFTGAISYGPRSVIGLLYMAKIIQPELFNDIDPAMVLDEYSREFFPEANKGNFIYPLV